MLIINVTCLVFPPKSRCNIYSFYHMMQCQHVVIESRCSFCFYPLKKKVKTLLKPVSISSLKHELWDNSEKTEGSFNVGSCTRNYHVNDVIQSSVEIATFYLRARWCYFNNNFLLECFKVITITSVQNINYIVKIDVTSKWNKGRQER